MTAPIETPAMTSAAADSQRLFERLGSTRGALCKALHDARRKLRAALRERGIDPRLEREEER